MCSFVVPDAKQFGIKKIQVDEQIGINPSFFSKPVARPRMRVSSLLGRNASCCDLKQLFPRLAGDALRSGTGALKSAHTSPPTDLQRTFDLNQFSVSLSK